VAGKFLTTKNSVLVFTHLKSEFYIPLFKLIMYSLINQFSSKYPMSVNIFFEIDRLVQLLETPIFIYLRLQLLEPEKYPYVKIYNDNIQW
jgi:hypothetical protein